MYQGYQDPEQGATQPPKEPTMPVKETSIPVEGGYGYDQPSAPAPPYDEHADDNFNTGFDFSFTEKSIRMGFIKKVYGILCVQLLVTLGFIAIFLKVDAVRDYSQNNIWLWIVALVLTFVCIIALACCPDVRRKYPVNIIMLGIFTICESFLLGAVSSCYKAEEVLVAVGITAVVCLALTIFAFQTKIDFTMMSGGLFVALICLLCFGFLAAIIQNQILNLVYASLGALLFGVYLVFDTQLMLGGKHKYSLSPEEYIFAALNLYLDIINMFLFILSIVGSRN